MPPCGGRLGVTTSQQMIQSDFNSCPPAGGVDDVHVMRADGIKISIHAPLRGASFKEMGLTHVTSIFQFMPPCGGRPTTFSQRSSLPTWEFQFMPPCGGRRARWRYDRCRLSISIHAPLRGASPTNFLSLTWEKSFQFMPPCGGRRQI